MNENKQDEPVQPEKKMLVSCPQCKLVFDGKSNRLNSEAQPVQPAVDAVRDAERYRWLREEHKRFDPLCHLSWKKNHDRNGSVWVNTTDLDHAIDQAKEHGL